MGNVPVYRIIKQRRTIRRFKQKPVSFSLLKKLVDAGRLAPSAANLQPLEFIIVDSKDARVKIFTQLKWAGYIAPNGTPPEDKRPTAYIIILVNKQKAVSKYTAYDIGLALENIILTAWQEGVGACCMQAIDRSAIRRILNIPGYLRVDTVVSLGYRDEAPRAEIIKDSVKYWKDKKGVLHVPKRTLREVLHYNSF